jgi:hypothetical protein
MVKFILMMLVTIVATGCASQNFRFKTYPPLSNADIYTIDVYSKPQTRVARTGISGDARFSRTGYGYENYDSFILMKQGRTIGLCAADTLAGRESFNASSSGRNDSSWNYVKILFWIVPPVGLATFAFLPNVYSYDISFDTSAFQEGRDISPSPNTNEPPTQFTVDPVTRRLQALDQLKASGAITEAEYTVQRKRVLNSL